MFFFVAEFIHTVSGDPEFALPGSVFSMLTSSDLGDTIAAAEVLMDGNDLSAFLLALVRWLVTCSPALLQEELLTFLGQLQDDFGVADVPANADVPAHADMQAPLSQRQVSRLSRRDFLTDP